MALKLPRRKFLGGFALSVGGLFVPRIVRAQLGTSPPFMYVDSSAVGLDPFVTAWYASVQATAAGQGNTAVILDTELAAHNALYLGLQTDSLLSKIKALMTYPGTGAGDTALYGALVPLISNVGNNPWTNVGLNFQPANLTVNGLVGNASNYLNTGINPSTAFGNQTHGGWSIYSYSVAANGFNFGTYNASVAFMGAAKYSDNNAYGYNGGIGNVITVASPGAGFYTDLRVSSTDHRLYFANGSNAHAQIGSTDTTSFSGTLPNGNMFLFAEDFIGTGVQFSCSDRQSFVCIHEGFTATDSANLFTRVQTFLQAKGGGFV